jgi:hypothetical protein
VSVLHTSFVLAYHGCSKSIGRRLIGGEEKPTLSEKDYDWLGPGFYVWESDPVRAREWAEKKKSRDRHFEPFVVGVALDLGNCLDLTNRHDLSVLQGAYAGLKETLETKGLPIPENRDLKVDGNRDKLLRNLDCAVIRYLHDTIKESADRDLMPYDTVRGVFQEGGELYPGSAFKEKTHTQIAILNLECIKGIFSLQD